MKSRVGAVAELLIVDLAGSLIWFPVWWYTKGLQKVLNAALRSLQYRVRSYALVVWLKNFFVPMFGQYDIAGRLISVFMRLVVFIGRSIALIVEAIVYVIGIALWVLLPPIALIMAIQGGILSLVRTRL